MKALSILLAAAVVAFLPTSGFALTMGFNQDVHNGTGVDAYAFHIEGTLESSTDPVQLDDYCYLPSYYPGNEIAGFSATYDGGTITPMGGNLYHYSGSWTFSVPVPTCHTVHFGKYWDETCNNIFVDVCGWWTDQYGNPITPGAGTHGSGLISDAPFLGFDVQDDQGYPQTLRLQNATNQVAELENGIVQVAVTDLDIPLEELVYDSPVLAGLTWTDIYVGTIGDEEEVLINLTAHGVEIPLDNSVLITRGRYYVEGGSYHFFADRHTSHPEPGTLAMLVGGVFAAVVSSWRRRR